MSSAVLSRALWWVAMVVPCAALVTVLWLAEGAAGYSKIFTLAGASSQAAHACRLARNERRARPEGDHPREACRARVGAGELWPAAHRHLDGDCLARLVDGTIVLCHESHLLSLSPNGFIGPWPTASTGRAALDGLLDDPPYARDLDDIDVAPDGSVLVLGGGGVARVRPDGVVEFVVSPRFLSSATSIAALGDGGAVVTGATESMGTPAVSDDARHDVLQFDRDGRVVRRVQRLPLNPRVGRGEEG